MQSDSVRVTARTYKTTSGAVQTEYLADGVIYPSVEALEAFTDTAAAQQ